MTSWWRFYSDAINDPKLLRLSDELFRAWTILLCLASKNGGDLPPADDIAVTLRMKTPKVAEWITKLTKARLLDNNDGVFTPHNWNTRQYKSDVSTERVKRFRNAKRNVPPNVSPTVSETAPEQIQNRTDQIVADAEDAREPLISDQAIKLADELMVIAGHDPRFTPPGWCGAAMRVQTWLSEGWPPQVIVAATRSAAARKHGTPANSVQFFEKAIAEEVARQAAPLPQVEIRQPETLKVVANGRSGNVVQAADRLLEKIRSFDAGPDEIDRIRDGEVAAPPRLLSQG